MPCADCQQPHKRLIPYASAGATVLAVCPPCWRAYDYWPSLKKNTEQTQEATICRLRREGACR